MAVPDRPGGTTFRGGGGSRGRIRTVTLDDVTLDDVTLDDVTLDDGASPP
jgi:hypothetical protein